MDKKSLIAMGTGLAMSLAMSASYAADSSNMKANQISDTQQVQKADGQCGASMNKTSDGSCGASMKSNGGSSSDSDMKVNDGPSDSDM